MSDDLSINNALTLRPQAGPSSSPRLGKIDQYELVRELGGGGFGCVFLAKDTVAGVEVAVKGLPPEVRHNKEELENIRANFALVSRLHHPSIAAALVLHPAKEVSYEDRDTMEKLRVFARDTMMVMEYAPGVTLSQWRKQFQEKKVPFEKTFAIVRQVAEALDYAHGENIVHRDVKPSNVMIETKPDGSISARVLDFGLAAEIRSSMGRVSREIRDTSGTRPYMAPEQWVGEAQNAQTDQYSLGVMVYELLTGKVPFASVFDTGDPILMKNTVTRQPFKPDCRLPRAVKSALCKALAKKPSQRFRTCAEFVDALTKSSSMSLWLCAIGLAAMVSVGLYAWRLMLPAPVAKPLPVVKPAPVPAPVTNPVPVTAPVTKPAPVSAPVAKPLPVTKPAPVPAPVTNPAPATKSAPVPAPVAKPLPNVRHQSPIPMAEYRIAYDLDNGVNNVSNPVCYKLGDLPIRLADPSRKGFKFIGWQPIGRIERGSSGDRRFAAKWEKIVVPKPLPPKPIAMAKFVELKTDVLASGFSTNVALFGNVTEKMIWCASGSAGDGNPVDGFWLGKFEVSQALWAAVLGTNPSRFPADDPALYPVEMVSREDCLQFVDKLNALAGTKGFRLPAEREWEYACRAGSTTAFFWGNVESSDRMCAGGTAKRPSASGKYAANKWGFCDMHGNVAEWCDDRFGGAGDDAADAYVLRGGSWRASAAEATASSRMKCLTYNGTAACGLRLCFSVRKSTPGKKLDLAPNPALAPNPVLIQRPDPSPGQLALKPGTVKRITIGAGVDLELVWCPPGSFLMGSPVTEDDRLLGVEDQHSVVLTKGFWMSKYEVTNLMWQEVMKDDSVGMMDGESEPKSGVSWKDCADFVARLNNRLQDQGVSVRLPTEAEWEYACRAGTTSIFSFGDVLDGTQSCCNGDVPYGTSKKGKTWSRGPAVVGHFSQYANKWGLNDMHGSLFEWCADWYEPYSRENRTDPKGPLSGVGRVVRGGCWGSAARECRSAFRMGCESGTRNDRIGFRLCASCTEDAAATKGHGPVASHIPVRAVKPEELKPGTRNRIVIADGVEMELLWCQPGSFLMGSAVTEDERILGVEDLHAVTLTEGFWMSKYEVTKQIWQQVMNDSFLGVLNGELEPKSEVSWHDCTNFVAQLNRRLRGVSVRLPTEAEWEYACRAGTKTRFAFGDMLNGDQACCDGNRPYGTSEDGETWKMGPPKVGRFSRFANGWGFNDMHGSLFEWCADWYEPHARVDQTDPTGPSSGDRKVIRGGCWRSPARQCRSAFRAPCDPNARNATVGFRICSPGNPPKPAVAGPAAKPAVKSASVKPLDMTKLKPGTCNRIALNIDMEPEFLWCPPGSFLMGSPETEDELNRAGEDRHEVVFTKGFWMAKYEVTKSLWQEVMRDDSYGMLDGEREPKSGVAWDDCTNFLARLNRRLQGVRARLPTEAEWEYACRAGTKTAFSFGDILNGDQACCNGNDPYGTSKTGETWKMGPAKVGNYSKFANKWGINDMHGNLFEWCADWFSAYPKTKQLDPTGPASGEAKIVRGGCWRYAARQCRSAFRTRYDPGTRNDMIGFRFCCDQVEWT